MVRNTVDSLISDPLSAEIDILEPQVTDLDEFKMISCKFKGNGKLVFEGGEYFLYVHSAHEDPEIGDV
jgi:hypothetical protein